MSDIQTAKPTANPPMIRGFLGLVVMCGVAFGLTSPLTAILAVALGASPLSAGIVVASMQMVTLTMNVIGTRWLPYLEPRRALSLSLLIFGVGSAVTAIAPNPWIVGVARAFQGLGTVMFVAVGPQLAIRAAGDGAEGRALGGFNAAWFLGIAVGPLAGGGLTWAALAGAWVDVEAFGARFAFAVCAALSLLASALVRLHLPYLASQRKPRLGLPSIPEFARPRALSVLVLGGLGQSLRGGLALTLMPLTAARYFGLSGFVLGMVLTVAAMFDMLAMYVAGTLADRVGRLPTTTFGMSLGVIGSMLAYHAVQSHSLGLYVVASALLGTAIGTGWVLPSISAVDLALSMESGLSAYRIAADIGMGLGSIAVGALVGTFGIGSALAGVITVLLTCMVLTAFIGETLRPPTTDHIRAAPQLAA
jgi:MFS family permease